MGGALTWWWGLGGWRRCDVLAEACAALTRQSRASTSMRATLRAVLIPCLRLIGLLSVEPVHRVGR